MFSLFTLGWLFNIVVAGLFIVCALSFRASPSFLKGFLLLTLIPYMLIVIGHLLPF